MKKMALVLISLLIPYQLGWGQTRAGSGYLKMMPGAREMGLGGTLTGAMDHHYSLYVNPGASGFQREWQWSVSYTNWISDLYNASFLVGKNFRTPWSRWTRFALGVNYLGIPEFNNATDQALAVSGQNLLITANIGQSLPWWERSFSVGANVKYFSSQLAGFSASKVIFDVGLLFRSPRWTLLPSETGLLDQIILSSGLSITNLGGPISYINEATPLPRTLRAGVAVNMGTHQGLQMSLGADYRIVRDESGYLTFGTEFSWRQMIALRMGYSLEQDNLLGHFTFGGGLRFDDLLFQNKWVGRNNALRFDLATNQSNEFFSSPYHGTVTHQPLGPEYFRLCEPAYNESFDSDSVRLVWETTVDPDLFDQVHHLLLVDPDSAKLARLLHVAGQDRQAAFNLAKSENWLVNQPLETGTHVLADLVGGDYFWMVLAYDQELHLRFGVQNQTPIAKFHVTAPNPQVIAMRFDYFPWITRDDYQGELYLTVKNLGDRTAYNLNLSLFDSLKNSSNRSELLYDSGLPSLAAGADTTLRIEWRTTLPGLHQIYSKICRLHPVLRLIHTYREQFHTIPKGIFNTTDTLVVQRQKHTIFDLPYLGKVFFDRNQAGVKPEFDQKWISIPPLNLFASRLKANPAMKIRIKGTADPNSSEQESALADQRARAVFDTLLNMGVAPNQMALLPGTLLPKRALPANPEDTRWVLEERRRVDIITTQEAEPVLFEPLQTTHVEKQALPVRFDADIAGVVPFTIGKLRLGGLDDQADFDINRLIQRCRLNGAYDLDVNQLNEADDTKWIENSVNYSIELTDSLQRRFQTKIDSTYFTTQIICHERRYFVPAQFNSTTPFYQFYWNALMQMVPLLLQDEKMRIRFEGHGCATGPDAINERLSLRRADDFQNKFLQDVRRQYPHLYAEVKQKLDPPVGEGESEPFIIKTPAGQTLLIGDNQNPLGRQLNRRVMVLIYRAQ